MALNINNEYTPRVNSPDANYPTGSLKDETVPGVSNDGTPLSTSWGNDYVGFTDALLTTGGITRTGTPDTALQSDRLKALYAIQSKLTPVTGGGLLEINKRHLITDASTYTLPNTTGLTTGQNVYIARLGKALFSDPTPVVNVNGSNGEQVDYYNQSTGVIDDTDTSILYNISAPLIFVFNATTGNWEL